MQLSDADRRILDTFVKDGRIPVMPTRRHKRLVVLDHVAQCFEPGRTYPEAEVNEILRRMHADDAVLTREENVYWRTGGTVVV